MTENGVSKSVTELTAQTAYDMADRLRTDARLHGAHLIPFEYKRDGFSLEYKIRASFTNMDGTYVTGSVRKHLLNALTQHVYKNKRWWGHVENVSVAVPTGTRVCPPNAGNVEVHLLPRGYRDKILDMGPNDSPPATLTVPGLLVDEAVGDGVKDIEAEWKGL